MNNMLPLPGFLESSIQPLVHDTTFPENVKVSGALMALAAPAGARASIAATKMDARARNLVATDDPCRRVFSFTHNSD
jgi:hypothetical protein